MNIPFKMAILCSGIKAWELAKILNIPDSKVSKLVGEYMFPTKLEADKIASALNVETSTIFKHFKETL